MGGHIQLKTKAFIRLAGIATVKFWWGNNSTHDLYPKRRVPNTEEGGRVGNKRNGKTKLRNTMSHTGRKKKSKKTRNTHLRKGNRPPHVINLNALLTCFYIFRCYWVCLLTVFMNFQDPIQLQNTNNQSRNKIKINKEKTVWGKYEPHNQIHKQMKFQ